MAAIIVSGIMLKKTKMFAGDPAPFVMELPAYHWPTVGNVLRSMWERGWSFIKKAGTIILLSTIFVWFTTYFGFVDGAFHDAVQKTRSTTQHPGRHRQRHCLDLHSAGLGQLAGSRGFHHRSGGQGKHRWHHGHPVQRRRRQRCTATCASHLHLLSAAIPSWPSTCSALPASLPWAPSSGR